jgi:nucleotide-binding universal stress UspA family protein
MDTRPIVVGFDGSECADAALGHAIDLARAFGTSLVVVYASEPPGRSVGEEYREHLKALEEIGEKVTAAAIARTVAAGVAATVAIVEEKPADALVDTAVRDNASMIVVGTWSERPLKGAILGSVPFKLLHRSPVPVVAVPVADV